VTADGIYPARSEALKTVLVSASLEAMATGQIIEISACLGPPTCGRRRRKGCPLCDRTMVFPDGTTQRVEGRA
jgi:hypothetical protein